MEATERSLSASISAADLTICAKVLCRFRANDGYPSIESSEFDALRPLIQDLYRLDQKIRRQKEKGERQEMKHQDRTVKNSCLLRAGRAEALQQLQLNDVLVPDGVVQVEGALAPPSSQNLQLAIKCYICKVNYRSLHFFYDRLCPSCAAFNYEKRLQTTDLSSRVALVTGGRVKIGFRITLKLLRANCFVIATSRFPMDLLQRLTQESDFEQWKDRIHVYGVDFRYAQLVERFADMLVDKYNRLDFLINNACQTIQRPREYYQHLYANERLTKYALLRSDQQEILDGNLQFYQQLRPFAQRLSDGSDLLALPSVASQPDDLASLTISRTAFDVNNQPVDLRLTNSWLLRLAEVSAAEVNEVLTINTLAPFVLNSKLKVLMADRHPDPAGVKFIINVSAMEGSFSRPFKTDRHPHTNAAKAALNMMTRTSASDYKNANIYMVSVDTGWINDENPVEKAMDIMRRHDFQTPLDEEDAAARVLDPIIDTYRRLADGEADLQIPFGCFLKDYRVTSW